MAGDDGLCAAIEALVWAAGDVVLRARAAGAAARAKADGSPVTEADVAAQAVLVEGMARLLPGVPIVAEEGDAAEGPGGATCVLIDPLDGTREFVAGHDDFTVNVAIVRDGRPVVGVLLAPALRRLFAAADGRTLERRAPGGPARTLRTGDGGPLAVLVSRSHLDPRTRALVEALGPVETREVGSSLKFGLLAAGEGALYPRLAPTRSWDIAAGQCVLEAAGGVVVTAAGEPLRHGAASRFRNDGFVAAASAQLAARALALIAR